MLGSVDRFILTPIVLRFARKYIKDPEGAAVSDLHVSVSGGSVVFRNFELNLEEIVKDLPCSIVRAFARQLSIKIPWTKLATDPIEVVLDTVECVLAEGKEPPANPKNLSKGKPAATRPTSQSPGGGDGGWMGTLLERALTNVSVRVNNVVCKFIGSGAVLTLSCQSAEIFSCSSTWERAFLKLEDGLRKRCVVQNISITLDNLTSKGTVDAYQDPFLRTPSVDLRFAFATSRKTRKQRCSLDVRLATWDANISDEQLQKLQQILSCLKSKGDSEVEVATTKCTPEKKLSTDAEDIQEAPVKTSWFDYSSDDSDEGESTESAGAASYSKSGGASMLDWAWNFLAEEDFGASESGNSDDKEAALMELEAATGILKLNKHVEFLLQCRCKGGRINLRFDHSGLASNKSPLSGLETHLPAQPSPNFPPLSRIHRVKNHNSDLIGTVSLESLEMILFTNKEGLQAITLRLNTFILMQSPDRHPSVVGDTILTLQSSSRGEGDRSDFRFEEVDLAAQFMSLAEFTINDITSGVTNTETQNTELQSRGALNIALWRLASDLDVFNSSQEHVQQKLAIHVCIGAVDFQYCPGLIEDWITWLCRIYEVTPEDKVSNPSNILGTEASYQEQCGDLSSTLTRSPESSLAVLENNLSCSKADQTFLELFPPFHLTYFQATLDSSSITVLSAENMEPRGAVILRTGFLRSSLCSSGLKALAILDCLGSTNTVNPAIALSGSHIQVDAGTIQGKNVIVQTVVFPFCVQLSFEQGGHASIFALKGLAAEIFIHNMNCSLRGADCHAVVTVLSGLVPVCNFKLPPISAFPEGVWIGVQISDCNGKIGYTQGSFGVQISKLTFELFESRFEFLCSGDLAGIVCNGSDKTVLEASCSSGVEYSKSVEIGLLRVFLTNKSISLVQAIQALNVSAIGLFNSKSEVSDAGGFMSKKATNGTINSKLQDYDAGGFVSKKAKPSQQYGLMVAEMEIYIIAVTGDLTDQASTENNASMPREGHMALFLPLRRLKFSVLLEERAIIDGNSQTADSRSAISLHGSLMQMQMLLGFVEARHLRMVCLLLYKASTEKDLIIFMTKMNASVKVVMGRPEMCAAMKDSYALRSGMECILCVSQIQSSYHQDLDSSPTLLVHQSTQPLIATEMTKLEILDIVLNISRDNHVLLYKFWGNFYNLPPQHVGLDEINPDVHQEKKPVLLQEVKKCINICVAQAAIKLDLWRDNKSPSLKRGMDDPSKLIFNLRDGSMVINKDISRKKDVSRRDPACDGGGAVSEYDCIIIDKCKVLVAYFDLCTSRTEVPTTNQLSPPTKKEGPVDHVFPLIRQKPTDSMTAGPLLAAMWSSGTQGGSSLIIELQPLDWFLDSQLIEEIVTVCWERRKHIEVVAGVDILPLTLNSRIVARAGSLHLVPLFSVLPTTAVVLASDYLVVMLDNALGADARQWAGVHDGRTPGVMDPNKLKIQNLDISILNWKVTVLDPNFPSPALVVTPTDLRVIGKFIGCPGPMFFTCITQNFSLIICNSRLSVLLPVLSILLSGWISSWPLRQQYISPPNLADDLRSGVFQISTDLSRRLARGELALRDGNANGGSLSWRYPFPRQIVEVLISDQLFSEVPGLPEDTAVIFQLCFFDEATGVFLDAAPHLVAIEGESKYRIEPFIKVEAEEWRLTWFLPPGALPTTPASSKVGLFPATIILKLLQVNPVTTNKTPLGDIPALLPFMLFELKAEALRLSLVQGWEDIEVAAIQGTDFHMGFHFWTSGLYSLVLQGLICAEYTDMSTYTHESLMEPFRSSLELSSCILPPAEHLQFKRTVDTKNKQDLYFSSFGPGDLRSPPTAPGYTLLLKSMGSMTLHIQKSFLKEASRIANLLSSGFSSSLDSESQNGLRPMQNKTSKLKEFAFTVENACPINLAFRQAGSQELIELQAGSSETYSWRNPPKLCPSAVRKLQICFMSDIKYTGNARMHVTEEGWWCEPIEVENGLPQQRQLLLDPTTSVSVVLQMVQCSSTGMQVVIQPSFQMTNMTAITLQVQIRGLFPSSFLAVFLGSNPGSMFKAKSETDALCPYSEGDLSCPLLPNGSRKLRKDILLATQLVRQSGKQATMRVLVEGDKGWSAWAPLEATFASSKLLLKNDHVDWKRTGGKVPPSSPVVCLEYIRPDSDSKGQMSVILWPLFYIENKLFRSLSLQVGLQGSDVVLWELEHNMEAPVGVTMSGRQYLLAKVGPSSGIGDRVKREGEGRNEASEHSVEGAAHEALESTESARCKEIYKSKPILLTASNFRTGARFDISYQELPPVGSHDTVVFSSLKTGHSAFSCILRTSLYKEGLPTILLSFLPIALLHNHYFLPMAVRDAWLPPESIVGASALPGGKSAFSFQGLHRQQSGKKVCIGFRLGDLYQQRPVDNNPLMGDDPKTGSSWNKWVWSTTLEVEADSIQEVTLGKGHIASHFLVRTIITRYNVDDESDACMCIHLAVYPVTLVSNFTGHTVRFMFNGEFGTSFWDFADKTKFSPLAAPIYAGSGNTQEGNLVHLLVSRCEGQGFHVNSKEDERTLICNGAHQNMKPAEEGKEEVRAQGLEHWRNVEISQVQEDQYFISDGIDLCKPVHLCRLMLFTGCDRKHAMMLTYSLGVVDRQYHFLIQRDPYPPCIVLNNTDYLLEVKGAKADSLVVRMEAYSRLDFDLEGLDVREPEGILDLDELFLAHMKKEHKASWLRIRAVGHVWSEPIHLGSQTSLTYVGSLSGSVKLSVKVEQLGPTFYIHVEPFEEREALSRSELETKGTIFKDIRITAHIEKLRVSIWDDDMCTLRGPVTSGKRRTKQDGMNPPGSEEVSVVTLEKVSFTGSQSLKYSSLRGIPVVSVQKMYLSLASLQVDMQLDDSELPVLLSAGHKPSSVSSRNPKELPDDNSLRVVLEFCKIVGESDSLPSAWLEDLQVFITPLTVNIDNATCGLARRLGSSSSCSSLVTSGSETDEKGSEAGDPPEHFNQFLNLEPQFYVRNLHIDRVKFLVTLRIARPVLINTHQAPVSLASFKVKESHFPLVVLIRGLLAHYTTQAVVNAPGVLGSMDILLNVTGLVKGIQAGLNDLLRLPLRGIQYGPHGFLFGLGAGGFSLVRHISVWTFTSIAGFASTLAQVLDSVYSDVPAAAPAGSSLSRGFIGFGQGVARGVSGIVLTPMRAANRGRSSFFLGVGKGLVGAVAGPVSGALQLVAHTSQGLVGTGGAPAASASLAEALVEQDVADIQQTLRTLLRTRSSRLRFERQILRGTLEKYVGHTEVSSLIYTSGVEQSPTLLQNPVLLLSNKSIRALEDGGTLETANLCLHELVIDEDVVTRTLTIYGATGVTLFSKRNGTICDVQEGLQLYVQLDEAAWRHWVPLLRDAVPRKRSLQSSH